MKQNKGRKSTADLLKPYVGGDVAEVILELAKKKDYSEFKLAEAVGREVNETRNLLYKLYNYGLASFIKKKDNKVGWYIHYWTFHEERAGAFLLNEKKNRCEALRESVSSENKGNVFSCANACVTVDFDKAFDLSFRCPECGELLNQENNFGKVKGWGEEIAKLEKEIGMLEKQKMVDSEQRFAKNTVLNEQENEGRKRGGRSDKKV